MDSYAAPKCLTNLPEYASDLTYLQFGTATTRKSESGALGLLSEVVPVAGVLGALWGIHEGNCKALTVNGGMHA